MQAALITATVFGSIILVLTIVSGTILGAIKIIKGGSRIPSSQNRMSPREFESVQQLLKQLKQMEDRIEILETLLKDPDRKDWAA